MTLHLKAVYEGGVFRPLEPVHIEEHQEVTLLLETADDAPPCADPDTPIWDFAEQLMRGVPEAELNALPADGAAGHDYYLYGSARRNQ